MSWRGPLVRWLLLGFVVVIAALASGCATTEADNASGRPWNAPRNWESGLPSSVYEGR